MREHGVSSADRRGLLFSGLADQIGRPIVHQPTSALEEVRAPVRRLGLPYPLR